MLETLDVEAAPDKLLEWYRRDSWPNDSLKDKIRRDVTDRIEDQQREYMLRQQLEPINKELDEGGDDIAAEYRRKADEAGLPDAVRKEVEPRARPSGAHVRAIPEHGWIRT